VESERRLHGESARLEASGTPEGHSLFSPSTDNRLLTTDYCLVTTDAAEKNEGSAWREVPDETVQEELAA